MEGQAKTFMPSSRAADSAMATTRSLNEWVGLPESSFTHRLRMPRARPRLSALSSLVKPGSMLGLEAMSVGTGSSGW